MIASRHRRRIHVRSVLDSPPGMGRSLGLSVVIITKDEARNIAGALESVAWADDVVVVDSGSDDETVTIARRYTDRLTMRDW